MIPQETKELPTIYVSGKPLSLRGRTFIGIVESDRMMGTVTVSWDRRMYVKKYERYERRRSTVAAHNPKEISARAGDKVMIMETRPISKTKHFVVVKILERDVARIEAQELTKKAEQKKATEKKQKAEPKKAKPKAVEQEE
nr:30S ribosomal protein S17P [uncultured archaeon]